MIHEGSRRERFPNRLRRIRHELIAPDGRTGISQHQMADRIGVSRSCYNSWECGRNRPRSRWILEQIDRLEAEIPQEAG